MRTPTSDRHFKDKIVRIILEILRYLQNISLSNGTRVRMAFCDKSATY